MFRPFHPQFGPLLRDAGDRAAAAATRADARRWFDMALAYAARRRLNVVAEHGLSRSSIEQLSAAGYRPGVAFLAVPAAVSRIALVARYHIDGRYVPPEVHDDRYRRLVADARSTDANPRVVSADVYDRAGRQIYHNERVARQWRDPPRAAGVIDAERKRQWTRTESEAFTQLCARLARLSPPELAEQVRAARREAAPLMHPGLGRTGRSRGRQPHREAGA
jgi:hypothetical protein